MDTSKRYDVMPAGPWNREPDRAVWVDPETDLDCMIVRNRMGALCGYAGVGPEHPLHGVHYGDDRVNWIDVHGCLTYSDECQEGGEICHVPQPGRTHDVWWFGFDCGHSGDLCPTFMLSKYTLPWEHDVYRNFEYVRAEVEHLARQLHGYPRSR